MNEERCIFSKVDFHDPDVPKLRGPCDECFAEKGKGIKECCFEATKRLIQTGETDTPREVLRSLSGSSEVTISRIRGVGRALDSYGSHR